MSIFYSLLILCCSIQPWKINAESDGLSIDGQKQLKKEAFPEDASKLFPDTVNVERIVKSSIYPYFRQDESKASKIISKTINSGGVNTTIRLKFVKENPGVSVDGVGDNVSENSTDDNLKQNVMNFNERASRLNIQEVPSHKIILHQFNKDTPEAFSKNMLQQLQNMKWPHYHENQSDPKDYKVHFNLEDKYITPVAEVVKVNLNEEGVRQKHYPNKQKAFLEQIKKYLEERDVIETTEKSINKRFKISGPQKDLLVLLNGLIQNKEISYDFMNSLINLFYKYGYQNQLLQVLFDFIFNQIHPIQGKSVNPHEQKIISNLNKLYQQQSETQEIDVLANKKSKLDESSSEQLKVFELLRLLNSLEKSNANGLNVLRLKYLNELNALYDTYDNKDLFMKIMHNHWKKNRLNKNKWTPLKLKLKEISNHNKVVDINSLLQSIFKQKPLISKNNVFMENDDIKPNLHKTDMEKSDVLPRYDEWKVLFELLSKDKIPSTERPNDFVIVESIYEEAEDDNHSITPVVKIKKQIKKKNKHTPKMDEKYSTKQLYQMLLQLLKSKNILNKGQLLFGINELINKIKSQNIKTISESRNNPKDNQDGLGGVWDILNKAKYTPEDEDAQECVVGTTWTTNCESCICMLGGVPLCKRMPDCIAESTFENRMQCKPNSKFRLDNCNTCKCNALGIPVCTFMECKESVVLRKKNSSKQDALKALLCRPKKKTPTCAPRTNWRDGCHDCVCDDDGQRHCRIIRNCNLIPLDQEERAAKVHHREIIPEE